MYLQHRSQTQVILRHLHHLKIKLSLERKLYLLLSNIKNCKKENLKKNLKKSRNKKYKSKKDYKKQTASNLIKTLGKQLDCGMKLQLKKLNKVMI